jgi:hypothetical protein
MEAHEPEEKKGFPVAFAIGGGVVLVVVAALWFWSGSLSGPAVDAALPFGPQEQQYAERIRFNDIKMSRAENMLGQEITFIECTLENAGTATLREIEVEIEFRDSMNQVVLREKRRLLGRYEAPLGGGRFRPAQFNFEHVPADWNQQYPTMRVTGLAMEP